jgi:hypothetical protein
MSRRWIHTRPNGNPNGTRAGSKQQALALGTVKVFYPDPTNGTCTTRQLFHDGCG